MKRLLLVAAMCVAAGCGADGKHGADGATGAPGDSCSVTQNEDGSATVACEDGTSATVGGGEPGESCSATDNMDGSYTLTCPDSDPITVTSGADGTSGDHGSNCTVADNQDGTLTVSCDDGTSGTITSGADGGSCSVTDNQDGTSTINCDDGTSATTSDGSDCTVVDNQDGTHTLSCEDGSSTVVADGTSCSIAVDANTGIATIACDDGSSVDMGCARDYDRDGTCDVADPNPCDPTDTIPTFMPMTSSETLVSGVNINGGGQFAVVNTGDSVSIVLDYSIASCGCTGCITQGMVGFGGTAGASCFYEGVPGCNTRTGNSTELLTAPSVPGMHYLNFRRTWQFSCLTNSNVSNDNPAAAICVLP